MDQGDLNEDELEELDVLERLYAVLHHTDETQQNVEQNQETSSNTNSAPSGTPKGTVRRYWHSSGDQAPVNTPFQKVNSQKPVNPTKTVPITKNNITPTPTTSKGLPLVTPKEEKPTPTNRTITSDLVSFGSPLSKDAKTTIKIVDHDDFPSLDLETSDEDEVIEVALPQKLPITIESSDEDEVSIVPIQVSSKSPDKNSKDDKKRKRQAESHSREVSASPVPSVVSSVSDEFIRGDCIALNISSRPPDHPSFDFSLHGSDLLGKPSKKKKKKKNKDRDTTASTTVVTPEKTPQKQTDDLFATPKNKAKNKKQKVKTSSVTEKIGPNIDVYDSDSNQSFDTNKKLTYTVTEKSLPCADVYESDSSQSEISKIPISSITKQPEPNVVVSSESSVSIVQDKPSDIPIQTSLNSTVVDLTEDPEETILVDDEIEENFLVANIVGFKEHDDYSDNDQTIKEKSNTLDSDKIPTILLSDLDFDNLKWNEKICTKQLYPNHIPALRDEMWKFYNESWGGEDFNYREIQKTMSRDKSLWQIDPKDRMPTPHKMPVKCNYCNRIGHRGDTCRRKPLICHMCGNMGHHESRCPQKICVNCCVPNHIYTNICRNCSGWGRVTCAECRQTGHPATHCPDLWRRYHNTIDNNASLAELHEYKHHSRMFCSGCARRGHLVNTCRVTLPFSGLPINSPYVVNYKPIYPPTLNAMNNHSERANKRQSKSPVVHETHVNKKRHLSSGDNAENRGIKGRDKQTGEASPQPLRASTPHRIRSQSENAGHKNITTSFRYIQNQSLEKTLDYISISPQSIPQRKLHSSNHDNKGQMIQDNEVSDTSDVRTSSKIYVTNEVLQKLKTKEGEDWLKETSQKHKIEVSHSENNPFLDTKGRLGDQEAFQAELRNWSNPKNDPNKSNADSTQGDQDLGHLSDNIPTLRNKAIRYLAKAFHSLKAYLGDPKQMLKELKYQQRNHYILQNQRIINPQKLSHATTHINEMLKKLNMVLLGQAGLADGSAHLSELQTLHQQLSSQRSKKVSLSLRKEIGLHYQSIFTAVPRDDYALLLKQYYAIKGNLKSSKKKKNPKKHVQNQYPRKMAPFRGLQAEPPNVIMENFPIINKHAKGLNKISIDKLKFYHEKLMSVKPFSKYRQMLARKFSNYITHYDKDKIVSASTKKRVQRMEEQAIVFLNKSV